MQSPSLSTAAWVPQTWYNMYELAMTSEDIRAIAIVAKEMTDRAYGRSVQAVQVSVDSPIMREAWRNSK